MAKSAREVRRWSLQKDLKWKKPRTVLSVPGLMPKYQPMALNWRYVYPKWAHGLPEAALNTIPTEFCPRRSTNNGDAASLPPPPPR